MLQKLVITICEKIILTKKIKIRLLLVKLFNVENHTFWGHGKQIYEKTKSIGSQLCIAQLYFLGQTPQNLVAGPLCHACLP